jgi:hypothetical protein
VLAQILETHAKYAGAYAARTLATLRPEDTAFSATVALYAALVRSGTPIPEQADRLFPIEMLPPERVLENARALPPGRRERALVAAMTASLADPAYVAEAVAHVVERLPMDEVRAALLAFVKKKKAPPRDAWSRQRLVAVEKRLTAATVPAAPVVLRVVRATKVSSFGDLDAVRVKQLKIAGDRWENTKRPAARRLVADDNDEASFGGTCEWRVLSDKRGTRRYDAWLFAGDAGAYFLADTTALVAERVQRSVATLRDADAATGLADALAAASKPRKR